MTETPHLKHRFKRTVITHKKGKSKITYLKSASCISCTGFHFCDPYQVKILRLGGEGGRKNGVPSLLSSVLFNIVE